MDVMAARRQILLNEPHIATATGAVATCVTDMRGLAKECVVQINPVQSGTGDPAPDNVRPISGWEGVTGWRTGVNMLDMSNTRPGYISQQGVITYDSAFCYTNPIYLPAGEIFTITGNHSRTIQSFLRVHGYDKDDNWIRQIASQGAYPSSPYDLSFTMPSDVAYIRISMPVMDDAQLSPGSTPTTYTPYTGTTYPVDWTDTAGTVYGGYVDLVSGVLVATWAGYSGKWQDGDNESTVGETLKSRRFKLGYIPTTGTANNICNIAPYSSGASEMVRFSTRVSGVIGYGVVVLPNDTSETTDIQIVSKLATPVTYQLTPQQITLLAGTSNLWADTGDTSVKFWKH